MQNSQIDTCLVLEDGCQQEWMHKLAEQCQLPIREATKVQSHPNSCRFLLRLEVDGLALYATEDHSPQPMKTNFKPWLNKASKRDLICRAIGRQSRTIIDATAGLGQDSAHLAAAGYEVTAVERHPGLAALLLDAKRRSPDSLAERISIRHGDSRDLLQELHADVVYLDPMFPQTGKSALPKRAMQVVRQMVGDDSDINELFELAMQRFHRVVVKRPDKAAPLHSDIHHRVAGKTVAYDVYINAGIKT